MRILVAHSRYMTGPVSGENRVVEDETRLMREAGHEVVVYEPTPVHPDKQSAADLVRTSMGMLWSRSAAAEVRRLIREHSPDVAHVHNLFPMLSPALIGTIHDEGVPSVMTLHNYRLLCLPATLERDGEICELCVGHLPFQGIRHGCYRGSIGASAVVASSLALHRAIGTFAKLGLLLPVSRFVADTYARAGIDRARMMVKPNFAWPAQRRRSGAGRHFLYAGRLAREKGIDILLRAWRPELGRLVVAGSGPEEMLLGSPVPEGVDFVGMVTPTEVEDLIIEARAVIVPSRGYETSGRIILEAAAAGVPAIASRIGGIPEAVQDGVSGLLVSPGLPEQLAAAMESLTDERSRELGEGAFAAWSARYAPEAAIAAMDRAHSLVLDRTR